MTQARPEAAGALPAALVGDRPPTALVCAGCGHRVTDGAPLAFACPAARPGDDVDHVLVRELEPAAAAAGAFGDDPASPNPYVRWRTRFHAYHRARAIGWSDADYGALVERLDAAVAIVDGHGFRVTPFARSDALSDALGFTAAGGVWVKDETGNVSGSHKARHLFGTLLELAVEEARARGRRPARCGPVVGREPGRRSGRELGHCGRDRSAAGWRRRPCARRSPSPPAATQRSPRRSWPAPPNATSTSSSPRTPIRSSWTGSGRLARRAPSATASRESPATRRTTPSCGRSSRAPSPSPARET